MDKKKKCVTFWVDEELLKQFDMMFHSKSLFIRECMKNAINDSNFYIDVTTKKNNKVVKNEKKIL